MSEVSYEEVTKVVDKLLEKAGKDPRLTPKILRLKAESKMQLPAGSLKKFRNDIKDLIWQWWEDDQLHTLQQLVLLTRALQLNPLLKGMKEMSSVTERVEVLTARLKEKSVKFSPCPTNEEIEEARVETERLKSLEEVDPSLIIDGKRKRVEDVKVEGNDAKKRIVDDDEEAEF